MWKIEQTSDNLPRPLNAETVEEANFPVGGNGCLARWHYDAEGKNTVNPWPLMDALPEDMQFEREIMPLLCGTLETGDWLYIPNGYWHRTWAPTESISLSIGIATRTGMDVFDFLRQRLAQSLRWRQRLPWLVASSRASNSGEAEVACHLTELGQDLAGIQADPALASLFLDHCRKTVGIAC